MLRSFGFQTVTGNAQPLLGDKITAAFTPPPDISQAFKLTVADSSIYEQGDRVVMGPDQTSPNIVLVIGKPDSTHILCQSEGNAAMSAWVVNTILALDIACAEIVISAPSTNAASLWLGSKYNVTNTGGGSAFQEIVPSGSYNLGLPQWNTLRSSEGVLAGTIGDKVGVVAVVI
jgi:hypothetical protein